MKHKKNKINQKNSIIKNFLSNTSLYILSDEFHKNTSIEKYTKKKTKTPKSWININYKTYPRLTQIFLKKALPLQKSLEDILFSRRSRRLFNNHSLSFEELSTILYYAGGISTLNTDYNNSLRMYPSAGARYPLEIYIVVNNIKEIKKGIYHYNIKFNSLELLELGNFTEQMYEITNQKMCKKAAFTIVITAVLDRTRIKYNNRGYRYLFIESGHLSQNIYLVSESLGLGCCTLGGFKDDQINNLLDLNGINEKTLYLAVIGKSNE